MNKIEKSILFALVSVIFFSLTGFANTCDKISDNVLRLHILADSDEEDAQNVKLAVRDRLLRDMPELFCEAEDLDTALKKARENIGAIEGIVNDELKKQGVVYGCKAQVIDSMYFEMREYDGFTMPAGFYCALRITLGRANGHNWWCVMYPPLCSSSCVETKDIFDEPENDVLSAPAQYEIKFKLFETACSLWDNFCTLFSS